MPTVPIRPGIQMTEDHHGARRLTRWLQGRLRRPAIGCGGHAGQSGSASASRASFEVRMEDLGRRMPNRWKSALSESMQGGDVERA